MGVCRIVIMCTAGRNNVQDGNRCEEWEGL